MCTPLAAVGFGLQAIGQVAGFMGQQQQTDDYNAAAKQNAINASLAATRKYQDEGKRLIYDTKKNMQEGYDAEMKARQSYGQAEASAGSSGLAGQSISVNSILSGIHQEAAINAANVETRQDDYHDRYNSDVATAEAEAQGRINSMPFKRGPSPLGMVLNIATAGFDSAAGTGWGKAQLGLS